MTKRAMKLLPFILSMFFMTLAMANQPLDSVVAVVNSDVITQSEVTHATTLAQQQLTASGNAAAITPAKLHQMVLQQLIDEKLMLDLAKQANITVTDAQVNTAIAHIAAGNHMTVAQMHAALKQHGMSYTAYRKMIRKQLLIHEVQQHAVGAHVKITPQDMQHAQAAFQSAAQTQQQFHVIDILAGSKADAQHIIAKVNKGANINTVAPKNTTDLGWQTANTLPTLFEKQLTHMKTGDVAGPIQAPNGYHVIALTGVRGQATAVPNKAQIQNVAYQIALQKAVKKWMVQVRKTAYIKITA